MNARLAISADAELPYRFEPFDEGDKVSLARRFRPFPQPDERRALFVVGYNEETLQARHRLWRKALDGVLVCTLAGKGARREGDPFQFERRGKQDAGCA